jgi:ABC-2 type transport system permease protein
MRAWFIFLIAFKQRLRDRLGLLLTVLTAPLFVILYWFFFSDAPATYRVAVLDEDAAVRSDSPHGAAIIEALDEFSSKDGTKFFLVTIFADRARLNKALKSGETGAGLILESGFNKAFSDPASMPRATLLGDATSLGYRISSALIAKVLEGYAAKAARRPPAVIIAEEPIGLSGVRTPFEAYVPGLLVFAVIMLIFSSSMSVVREVESGTLARLRLTPVTSMDLLVGLSAVQLILGVASVLLTLATAHLLGFRSQGSLLLAMLIAAMACLSSVGIGMFVASLSKTQTRAFLISSMAMFLLILFSGIVFPRPEITIATVGSRAIDVFDALPTTHMGAALGKVMTLGATAGEVGYELVFLAVITLLNYVLGGVLFARSGRPSANVWEGLP